VTWIELTPDELLSEGLTAPRITDHPWLVRWDRVDGDVGDLVSALLPDHVDLPTSGTTGTSRPWRRTREQLWAEAGLLADLLAPARPEAVLAFAPPRHLYGALVSVLVPARLGLPAWYRPSLFGPLPPPGQRRWAVMAIPWVFSLLLQQLRWVAAAEEVAIVHSTAMLPGTATDLLRAAGPGRVSIVEIFGSTETGGIATRRWPPGDRPWELFDDVHLVAGPEAEAGAEPSGGAEVPLVVRSPRLAAEPGRPPLDTWEMDDLVVPVDGRRFRFLGRRSRLVKVNGRRVNLDEAERSLRSVIRCADLALVPVADAMIGEHVDLLVVPEPGTAGPDVDIAAVRSHLGVRPRRVHVLERIERTANGKLRRVRPPRVEPAPAAPRASGEGA
jgi:acyl-coenzyme A synthetase/AMP-(fatty) acid ligase